MADPEAYPVAQVFCPIENNPNALQCESAPLIAKSASLTATNYAVTSNSQHLNTSNSPVTAPQVLEESGDFRDQDSACDDPVEFTRALGDAHDSVKSHSSTTSSSVDAVFLTAPETPTGSVDHEVRPGELDHNSSGTYNAVEGPNDKGAVVPASPTVSKATKSENSDDRLEQFSSVNCDSQEATMTEPEKTSQTSASHISYQEESTTGARLGLKPDIFPNDNPAFSQSRRRNRVVQTPRSSRRHAIPIIRPPTPGSEEPPLEHYDHGLDGVPSHYIPLYGSSHGMFYDPIIKMFVGDGPPRSTPERADGSMPCMPENSKSTAAKAANAPKKLTTAKTVDLVNAKSESRATFRRKDPDDILHIQPRRFINDFNLVPQAVGDSLQLGYSAPDDGTYPVGRPPNKKLYFCRCTGGWLPDQHRCNRGPLENMPEQSGLAITSQSQLPDGWVTHRIVVDPRMYPGGVVPEQTAAGPMVGGQPAIYFTPVSKTGTDPRTAEAARAAAFAITQSRGASQVRAMRRGAASSDAKAPVPPSSNSSLPIRSETNQPHTQPPAKDNATTSAVSVSSTTPTAPIIAATGVTAAIADPIFSSTGSASTTTTPASATALSDLPTTIPNPAPTVSDHTITVLDPTTVAPDPPTILPPSPTGIAPDPISLSDPSASAPTRDLGRPAQKVAGQRHRHGKGAHKSRKGR